MKELYLASASPNYVFRYPGQTMMGELDYQYQKNFLNKKELGIIDSLSKHLDYQTATTGAHPDAGNPRGNENPKVRMSKIGWIHYNNDTSWLYDKIFDFAYKNTWGLECNGIHDAIQYTVYPAENQVQYYHSHRDVGAANWWRKVSITIQLSEPDEFEGGGFQIEDAAGNGEWITSEHEDRGDLIMFPSFMRHQALPVTKGTRKCLVVWVSGPPLR